MIQVSISSSPSLQPFYNIILFISQHISSFYYYYEANWKTIITIPIQLWYICNITWLISNNVRRTYHENNLDKIFRISRFLRFPRIFMKRIVYYVLFLLLFTSYRTVQHDELFEQIVNKSCRNAFIVTLLTTAIIMFIEMLFPNPALQEIDIALIFGTLILTFGFSMFFYDKPVDEMEDAPWRS